MLHQAKFIIIQTVLLAVVAVLWFLGLLTAPFTGVSAVVCGAISGVGILALVAVYMRRWEDARWLAVRVVKLGLLGTVIGLIAAFGIAAGSSGDPEAVRGVISSVIGGMWIALYGTLFGVAVNLWIETNIKLLA